MPDLKDFQTPGGRPKVNITPDMMKGFKTLTCDCGGVLFQTGVVVKKISPIVSPSGKEELYPMEVLICQDCGKVPNELNVMGMLPEKALATPVPESAKYEFPKTTLKVTKDENK